MSTSHTLARRTGIAAAAAGSALMAGLLTGCEINKPEMPSFDTTVTLPLGVERLDVLDAVDGEDYLSLGEDGALVFRVEGNPVDLALDYDLSLTVEPQSTSRALGVFELPAPAPLDYGFTLGDMWAPASTLDGQSFPVPAFPIDVVSADQDVPDVVTAALASGSAVVRVANGLPVPISADGGPDQLDLVLEDPADGRPVAVFPFGAVDAGGQAEVVVDLTGVVLPDRLQVRLQGGSPGSEGQPVTVNAQDAVSVDAEFRDLVVTSATAVVEAQTVTTSLVSELPADYTVTSAEIASGSLRLDLRNDLPLPCTAVVVWPQVRNAEGLPVSARFDLAAGAAGTQVVDFANCAVDGGGAELTSLNAEIAVSSPGSGGLPVALDSADAVAVEVGGAELTFARLTGVVPAQEFPLDASEVSIDLPDELDGLQLTAASLTLRLDNSSGVDAQCDLVLTGVSAGGRVATLDVYQEIPSSYDQGITYVTLDQTNSDIVPFLNNLPELVSLSGLVSVGGDGQIGTVRPGDHASIGWDIAAPVEVVVTGATLRSDPQELDLDADLRDRIETHAQGARVRLEVLNHLPFDAELMLTVAADSASLDASPLLVIGPLTIASAAVSPETGVVVTPTVSRPTVDLDTEESRVFGLPGLVTRVTATLPDNGGRTVRVLSTDYLEVRGSVQLDVLVDDEL